MNINNLKNKNIHFIECENWYDVYGYEKSQMKVDTINYIEQLQQENQQLKEINEEHKKLNGELREENKKLKKKYENTVADYEYEKSKNHNAIEYMKPRFMNCINKTRRYFEDYDIQQIYEILKGETNDKR